MKIPSILSVYCIALFFPAIAEGAERPLFLPFDVTLGGIKAEMKTGNELFAEIAQPVKPDAVLTIGEVAPMLIVNAFPCKEDGTVLETQAVGVIFANNTKEVKLSDTMDKKPLAPGSYLANIVAHGKTARIVFQVGEPAQKTDFSKIFQFLKKKATGG